MAGAAPPPMPSLSHLPPDQQELLGQVLKMTPAQIATLPPEVQAQVQMLKAVRSFSYLHPLNLTALEFGNVPSSWTSSSSTAKILNANYDHKNNNLLLLKHTPTTSFSNNCPICFI
jgi:hypothetical protein